MIHQGPLMCVAEISKRLGVSRQRVAQLAARPSFPRPYDELDVGRIWLTADVERWIAEHRPQLATGGNPPVQADLAR